MAVKSMTLSDFRIRQQQVNVQWAKCKMTNKREYADNCLKLANKLLEDLNSIYQFEGQQERIDIEQICFERSKQAIKDKTTNMVDLQIAKNMYDSSDDALDKYGNLLEEAKQKVQDIIDGVDTWLEMRFPAKS